MRSWPDSRMKRPARFISPPFYRIWLFLTIYPWLVNMVQVGDRKFVITMWQQHQMDGNNKHDVRNFISNSLWVRVAGKNSQGVFCEKGGRASDLKDAAKGHHIWRNLINLLNWSTSKWLLPLFLHFASLFSSKSSMLQHIHISRICFWIELLCKSKVEGLQCRSIAKRRMQILQMFWRTQPCKHVLPVGTNPNSS